jgi:hypothetical protein
LNTKKAIASASAFAVGMAGLSGANVTGLSKQEASKWWTASATVRGFYDDNNLNSNTDPEASFGVETTPAIAVNFPFERTLASASYSFTARYFEARLDNNVDQEHQFDASMNHKFTPRHSLDVEDSFVSSTEPEVIAQGSGAQASFQRRADLSAIRNRAILNFNTLIKPTFGTVIGYQNQYYDYSQTGPNSFSALLDRMENGASIDNQWFPRENARISLGYRFSVLNYLSDDPLVDNLSLPPFFQTVESPSVRDSMAHSFFLGGERQFTRRIQGSGLVGFQYVDYFNQNLTDVSPYLDFSGTYTYGVGSSVKLGVKQSRAATDEGLGTSGVTLDQLAITGYAAISHRITSRLNGAVSVQYQNSTFNGGDSDGLSDNYFFVNLSLEHKLTEHLYASLSYTWEDYSSDRAFVGYDRNRVFLGMRAIY